MAAQVPARPHEEELHWCWARLQRSPCHPRRCWHLEVLLLVVVLLLLVAVMLLLALLLLLLAAQRAAAR